MTYPLKYLISFACSFFLFSLFEVFSLLLSGEILAFNPGQWLFQKSVIEVFLNFSTIQILAVIFTFAFWIEPKELKKWKRAPFNFVIRLFLLFTIQAVFLYGLRDFVLTDVSREFYALEENEQTIAGIKTELLELQAQKGYLENRLAQATEEGGERLDLQLAYADVLTRILNLYSRYATIQNSDDMQDNIRVARRAVELNQVELAGGKSPIAIPFGNLTSEEMTSLAGSFEKQKDYITALYLMRLLTVRDSENPFYKTEEMRFRALLDRPESDPTVEAIRSTFAQKQRYYLAFDAGRKLEAFYGIQEFLRKFPDDRDAEELFKRVDATVHREFIFDQDIMNSFEMGGPRAIFLLNENTDAYKEYVYLGKIIGFGSRVVIRDISILRIHPNRGLSLYLTIPYASFDSSTNSLIFDVIDAKSYNPYLDPMVKRGSLEPLPKEWKLNYSLKSLTAFSLIKLSSLSDLSFSQVWEASRLAKDQGDTEHGTILFYEALERLLAPFSFILLSLWLVGLSLKYPVLNHRERTWGMVLLVISASTMGALLDFFFFNFVAFLTTFIMNNFFGLLIIFAVTVFFIGWIMLSLAEILRKQKA